MSASAPERSVGWGLVGASNFAATYVLPAIRAVADAHPLGVFSNSSERGAEFARRHGLGRPYSSLEELLADPEVDAVYVSSTNDRHAPQTIAAAGSGKHVLCEKPLAVEWEDALAMQRACAEAGVVLGTNHHLRGAPTIVAMRRLIEAGEIGDPLAARVFHARSLPQNLRTWRTQQPSAGAGVILDITVHDADTLRFLLGEEIETVSAVTANQGLADGEIEDSVMGVMRGARGTLASFHDAFTIAHAGTGIEVHGTSGSLIGTDVLMPDPVGDVFMRREDKITPVDIPRRWPLYEYAIARFVAAIRGEGAPLASGADGVASLACALAAHESARSGGRQVVVRRSESDHPGFRSPDPAWVGGKSIFRPPS